MLRFYPSFFSCPSRKRLVLSSALLLLCVELFIGSEDFIVTRFFHIRPKHNRFLSSQKQPNFTSIGDLFERASHQLGLESLRTHDVHTARALYHKLRPATERPCKQYKIHKMKNVHIRGLENSRKLAQIEVDRLKRQKPLAKTVFVARPKVVLFVGLEGTGHHFVQSGFKELLNDLSFSRAFDGYTGMVDCATHWKVFQRNSSVRLFKDKLRNFQSEVVFLNSVSGNTMQSYPNCVGAFDRVLKEPDARQLAQICEEAGLDFQIVLLVRSPESVLISTTVNRDIGPSPQHHSFFYNYVLDIIINQLNSLDTRFVSGCINIETNKTEAKRLLSPLRRRISLDDERFNQVFDKWSKKNRTCIQNTHTWTPNVVQLYKKSLLLESVCQEVSRDCFQVNESPFPDLNSQSPVNSQCTQHIHM